MFHKFLIFTLLLILSFNGYGQNTVNQLLKDSTLAAELNATGVLWRYSRNDVTNSLIFNSSAIKSQLDDALKATNANYSSEFVYFEPSSFVKNRPSDLEIYNSLLDLKKFEQIAVKKNSKKPVPLFSPVHLYSDETFKTRITAIEPVTSIPPSASYYAMLKDERLGMIKYKVDYAYSSGRFTFKLTNLQKGKILLWNIVDPEDLSISYIVQPVTTGYLHVVQVAGNFKNFDKIDDAIDLNSFFSRRVEAFKSWYFADVLNTPIAYGIRPWGLQYLE